MTVSSPLPDTWGRCALTDVERAFHRDVTDKVKPASYEELADVVRYAEARGLACVPAGGGSHAYLGNSLRGQCLVVSSEAFGSVLRYEPDDFTIGVQAGARLADLRRLLAENGQEVAADFPAASRGTVGGMIAAALPGPRSARFGGLRSQVIGMHALRGGGRLYKTGGMVVKNVAGYEVAKFLCGSLGTAGMLLEVNFKLRPLPEKRSAWFAVFADRDEAWRHCALLRRSRLEPSSLTVLEPAPARRVFARAGGLAGGSLEAYTVVWTFEGNRTTVTWLESEVERLFEERPPAGAGRLKDVDALLDFLCDFTLPEEPLAERQAVVLAAVLPSRASLLHSAVETLFERWPLLTHETIADGNGGRLTVRWRAGAAGEAADKADDDGDDDGDDALAAPLAELRQIVEAVGGAGWVVYLPAELRARWPYLLRAAPAAGIAGKLLRVFDPEGVFCPGRVLGSTAAPPRASEDNDSPDRDG